jgi:phage FluMu protein Com
MKLIVPFNERRNTMQLRCTYCQTMFAIGREEKLIAIQSMNVEDLQYYHAYCPKCRRANRVERLKLERSYPNWQADLKEMTDAPADEDQAGKDK